MGLPSQAKLEGMRQEPGAPADGTEEMRQRDVGRGDAPWGLGPEMGREDGPSGPSYRDLVTNRDSNRCTETVSGKQAHTDRFWESEKGEVACHSAALVGFTEGIHAQEKMEVR